MNFILNKEVAWIAYSLDGSDKVTIEGNTTLNTLTAGLHNLTLFATDIYGLSGTSKTITFTIAEPEEESTLQTETEPFTSQETQREPIPTALVIAASVASAAVIAVGCVVYLVKLRKRHKVEEP